MPLISKEYIALNEKLHADKREYGTSGANYLDDVVSLTRRFKTTDILDYGCGKGTLQQNLPFAIKQYDPAIKKHAEMPLPSDIVICTDVLEHIEPECINDVLSHISSLVKKVGYLSAETKPAVKFLADGRNAHLIVEPAIWWINKINEYFHIERFVEMELHVVFIVFPKRKD